MKKKPKRLGGIRGGVRRVHNIKEVTAPRGNGPQPRNVVGFGKSLPTHAVVKPGYPTGTFAVRR